MVGAHFDSVRRTHRGNLEKACPLQRARRRLKKAVAFIKQHGHLAAHRIDGRAAAMGAAAVSALDRQRALAARANEQLFELPGKRVNCSVNSVVFKVTSEPNAGGAMRRVF